MYDEIQIKGFRGLRDFTLKPLGRVNLLVGMNNSGKTSILEAIELLGSRGSIRTIWNATSRRGERFWIEEETRRYSEGDVSHLFYGHGFKVGSNILVSSNPNSTGEKVEISVLPESETQQELFADSSNGPYSEQLNFRVEWSNGEPHSMVEVPLSPRGGIQSRAFSRQLPDRQDSPPVQFISTSALSIDEVMLLFDEVVLTPEEDLLVEALGTIEPAIDRIASIGSDRSRMYPRQGGIVVKLNEFANRIPIGSMGDGMWRMLGIALALVNARNGILLIDEIDTGLHYSVLPAMWKLVNENSTRLNIQVFATTHSRDCYESLATIANENVSSNSDVTIQRIDSEAHSSTVFSEQEIVAAAERGIEVR